jgi:large subunit ribosomal protein L20
MPRVKRGTTHVKRRKRLLKQTKGYKWGRKNLIRLASTASTLAGAHAYRDRRLKKRTSRALWQIKINAFARENDLSYSKLINLLKVNKVELDRKILADLSTSNKKVLQAVIDQVKQK